MKTFNLKSIAEIKDFPFRVEKAYLESDFFVHNHDFSELVVISGGTGIHIIGREEYPVRAGDIYAIKGDMSHGFKGVDNLRMYNIMYDIRTIALLNSELKRMPGFQALFVLEPYYRKEHCFKSRLQVSPEMLEKVVMLLDTMIEEYYKGGDCCRSMLQAYFTTLVIQLSRGYACSGKPVSKKLFYIAEVVAHMESSYNQPVSLEGLASRAFLSKRHFNRVFRQNYGTTPMEYIIRLRLEHACSLLKNSGLNITQVAQESGFSDSNYFSRLFRQKYGVSPGEYRKKLMPD